MAYVKTQPAPGDGDLGEMVALLTRIWRRILEVSSVSPEDDFFDLGGDSLKAVLMLEAVESCTGRRLPTSVLLRSPSVAALARETLSRDVERPWSPLVVLNERGPKTPIVGVHGAGDVLFYARLAGELGSDQPFFALQAQRDREGKLHASIPEIAAAYTAELRNVRPRGPYILAGICIGSGIALEMARRLAHEGERVDGLVFFDTAPAIRRTLRDRLRKRMKRLSYYAGRGRVHIRDRTMTALVGQKLVRVFRSNGGLPAHSPGDVTLKDAYAALEKRYRATRYDGAVIFLQSDEFANRRKKLPHLVRAKRIAGGGVRLVRVPGGHHSQFHEPNIRVLAERLAAALSS